METERNPMMRINVGAKLLLNQKNYILKSKGIATVEIDEIKENIRPKICNGIEEDTKGMNGDKMVRINTQHQNRDEERNNTGLGKMGSKHSGQEVG
jgi:hypothetical protein